ncbi:beta-amyrin 28-monooxygenase-like [Coffea eugenioides]|uniref:beta-amyrin 28-monooxygenase-like n=1 Tax=Coffea eugenioides TaxID=49369 RepID=UPI000F61542C|nr:beta-amyrin 28-monooxygenase-like [Coffea eugenioides]
MEAFSLYFLTIVVVLVSFIFLGFLSQRFKSKTSILPTGTFGLPVVGETLHFFSSGPEKFIHQRMEKYSAEVFATSLFGKKVAVVCGAAGNKFLLYTANDQLAPWLPSAASKLMDLVDSPGQSVRQVISKCRTFLYNEILNPKTLRQYITIMDALAREHLKTEWDPSKVIQVYPLCQKYALSLSCRLLLGLEDACQIQRISDSFWIIMQGLFSMPINMPGTRYNRALKEVKRVKHQFLNIIAKKRDMVFQDTGSAGSDVLSRILLEGNAYSMSDSEIGAYLLTLMLPSYEGISATITFALNHLAELPHIYEAVYKELMEIARSKAPEELLNWEDVKKMKYSWNVICESMRLTPPSMGTFREALIDINFAGITIPRGWKMHWSPFTTNKNHKYFPDPEAFDPTRYEGDGPTSCTFLPFSAGPRMCPGKDYSMFLILVYIYNVVTRFKLQKLIQDEKMRYRVGPVPANGLPMRLQTH